MNRPASSLKRISRPFLFWFGVLFVGSAHAEWVQLGRSDNFRVYLEQKLVQKNGDFAQIWQLMDFTTAQWADAQTAIGSIKSLVEYDCGQPRSRSLFSEAYSEQMSEGRLVSKDQFADPQWEGVEPGSIAEQIRVIACGKKK